MSPDDRWLDFGALDSSARLQDAVQRSLAAIDRIHRFPPVARPIPIISDDELPVAGRYVLEPGNERILLHPRTRRLSITLLHEIGHMFDHHAAEGDDLVLTDDVAAGLLSWWQAMRTTDAYLRLRHALRNDPQVDHRIQASYALRPSELFARSYAQYFVSKSKDMALIDELMAVQGRDSSTAILPLRWTDDDFADVRDALDTFMEARGWLLHSE